MTDAPQRPTRLNKRERAKTITDNVSSALDELWDKLDENGIPQHWMERIHDKVGTVLREQITAFTEEEECPNCGSDETEFHDPGFSQPALMRCGQCGLRWEWEGVSQTEALNRKKEGS